MTLVSVLTLLGKNAHTNRAPVRRAVGCWAELVGISPPIFDERRLPTDLHGSEWERENTALLMYTLLAIMYMKEDRDYEGLSNRPQAQTPGSRSGENKEGAEGAGRENGN